MRQFLSDNDLSGYYDHYLSIETTLLNNTVPYQIGPKGKYFPDADWNPVKAQLCEEHDIDIIYDNSVAYQSAFDDISTVFCLVVDKP